ncbi:MAG: hypothetical protein ACI9S8_001839 [Chlamydiales bacterium]|jgi:hypothetical protein
MAASLYFPQGPPVGSFNEIALEDPYLNVGQYRAKVLKGLSALSVKDWVRTALKVTGIGITLLALTDLGGFTVLGITAALSLSMGYYQTRIYAKRSIILPQRAESVTPPGEFVGNKVLVTENVKETVMWQEKLVRSAKHSIELSGCYCGGEIFTKFLGIFKELLNKNPDLQIRIISHRDLLTSDNWRALKEIQESYGERFFFLETSRRFQFLPNFRVLDNHTKMLVVDEKYLVTGGSGIFQALSKTKEELDEVSHQSLLDRLMGKGARDMDAVVSGPIAQTVRQEFYHLLAKWDSLMGNPLSEKALQPVHFTNKELLENRAKIEELENETERVAADAELAFVCGSPEQGEENGCVRVLKKYMASAEKSIYVGNMVLNESELIAQLALKGSEGLEVNVISNGFKEDRTFSKRMLTIRNRLNYPVLVENGVNIFEYTVPAHLYHKKVAVFDKKVTILGSFNISAKSKDCDDESLLIIDSEKIAQQTIDILKEDIRSSQLMGKEEISKFSSLSKLAGRILNMIFDHRSN